MHPGYRHRESFPFERDDRMHGLQRSVECKPCIVAQCASASHDYPEAQVWLVNSVPGSWAPQRLG